MSLLAPGLSARIKGFPNRKPEQLLPFYPGLVAPEWEPLWAKASLAINVNGALPQFDYATKQLGVVSGTGMTRETAPVLGPSVRFPGATSDAIQFSGRPPVSPTKITMALLVHRDNVGSFEEMLTTSTANSGFRLGVNNDNPDHFALTKGGVISITSTIVFPIAANVFCAASHSEISDEVVYLVKNLDTGEVLTQTLTNGQAAVAGNGTYQFGGFTTFGWDGPISMGFICEEFFPLSFLRMWADDPFGPFRTRSLPLFLPSVAAEVPNITSMISSTPRWDSKVRFY